MVDFKFHWVKIFVSFIAGLLGSSFWIFKALGKHLDYKAIPGMGNYYSLWGTIVRDELWGEIIAGFSVSLVLAYVVYSLVQRKRDSELVG